MSMVFSIRNGWVGLSKIADSMKRGSKHVKVTLLQHNDAEIAKILKEKAQKVKENYFVSDLTPM